MININIDDKYEIVKTLYQSAATAVVLVRHKKIGALRILKAISKASPNADSILSEAHLLQGIDSSLIPTIFEVEETDEIYYLIEEYIDGISLREYVLSTKINLKELIDISIKICELIEVMHMSENEPVLYLDMKPEHVIMHSGELKLIDFGNSIIKSNINIVSNGTPNWAPPEQINGMTVDERADIYSVGKVIEFMLNNSYAKDDYRLKKIVSKAVATSVELRTKSILELKKQLMGLQGSDEYENIRERRLEKKIAVVGEGNSVGVTHIAIALCQYLNGMKLDAYYRDKEKNTVNELWKNLRGFRLKEGVLYHESFKGLMNYGKAVKQYKPPIGIEIIDCGANIKDLYYDADIILYITSGTPWKKKIMYPHWIKDENVYIINNFAGRISTIKLAKELKKKVYLYPVVRRSLRLSKDEEKVFNAIIKNEKDLQFKKGKK